MTIEEEFSKNNNPTDDEIFLFTEAILQRKVHLIK